MGLVSEIIDAATGLFRRLAASGTLPASWLEMCAIAGRPFARRAARQPAILQHDSLVDAMRGHGCEAALSALVRQARIQASWTHDNGADARPRGKRHGSLDRRHRFAVSGPANNAKKVRVAVNPVRQLHTSPIPRVGTGTPASASFRNGSAGRFGLRGSSRKARRKGCGGRLSRRGFPIGTIRRRYGVLTASSRVQNGGVEWCREPFWRSRAGHCCRG